jgi:hypothetical protein
MSYTGSMAGTFATRHRKATDDALVASAQELINGLKDPKPLGLRGGYTSGAFVTGNLLGSIQATDPYTDKGVRAILVFTDLAYAEYWDRERGHYNIFSRRQEQESRWKPTLRRKDEDILAVYARVYRRSMGG